MQDAPTGLCHYRLRCSHVHADFFPDWGITDACPVPRVVHGHDAACALGAGGSGSLGAVLVVTQDQEIENGC